MRIRPVSTGQMAATRCVRVTPVFRQFFGQSSSPPMARPQSELVKVRHDVPLDITGPLCLQRETGAGAVLRRSAASRLNSRCLWAGASACGIMAARVAGARRSSPSM